MNKLHDLKTENPYFNAVVSGKKTFEVRFNDRDFKVGDRMCLQEFDKKLKQPLTGKEVLVKITYILDDPLYCKPGYVIIGFQVLWHNCQI